MNSSPTELYLPPSFPYPIRITSISAPLNSDLHRGHRLLEYSFLYLPPASPDSDPPRSETRFGTWDSPIDGVLQSCSLAVGDVISLKKAKERPVIVVIEPCKHGMQHGGLCVICGKDMTNTDYIGFSDAARANIQMTHSAFGPTVSLEYARELERESADHLLKSRKLSLIVDLDQTIVHATVDPTVGEWINEGEAWEARQAKKLKAKESERNRETSTTPGDGETKPIDNDDDDEDECNPNWEALKDVKRFRLGPESFGPPALRDAHRNSGAGLKAKNKMVETEGCMYYIKPRPGWKEFLRETATKYEMHVYTMGTRAYAEEVCAAIDPEGSIFGGRLLSRDESGSLTQKSLQRLFPSDTSMVVIIDDRADVWEWSPNLLKVIPYDFFIGIGDINSSFLPKIEPLTPSGTASSSSSTPAGASSSTVASAPGQSINANGTPSPKSRQPDPSSSDPTTIDAVAGAELDETMQELETTAMFSQNNAALDAQLEERPLARKEKEMQEHELELEHHGAGTTAVHVDEQNQPHTQTQTTGASTTTGTTTGTNTPTPSPSPSPKPEKMHKKALLKNDDYELDRIGKLLNEVHSRFFNAYEEHLQHRGRSRSHSHSHKGHKDKDKTKDKSKSKSTSSKAFDVTQIIPRIRSEVFEGVHILFSSVIPLDTQPESTEIWRMAHMFGAKCSTELTSGITHVVAAKRGTVKVDMARRRGGIKIVWLAWFTDSIALWQRQDEKPYLLDDPPVPVSLPTSASATTTSTTTTADDHDKHLTSSDIDLDLDSDDWDQESLSPTVTMVKDSTGGGTGGVNTQMFPAINWDDINDEVEAAMNESDDDDDEADYGRYDEGTDYDDQSSAGMRSGNVSEAEDANLLTVPGTGSTNSTPLKRKRLRSRTPSDYGGGGPNGSGLDDDSIGSPLSKRKKIVADRTGSSKLKEGITAEEVVSGGGKGGVGSRSGSVNGAGTPEPKSQEGAYEEGDGDDEEEDEEEEEEDDFLARELEEEWG